MQSTRRIKVIKRLFLVLLLGFFVLSPAFAGTDKYNDGSWKITSDGNLLPVTTNSVGIGNTALYPSQVCLGGSCITSWGTTVSPWEVSAGTTFLTSAPTKFIATDSTGSFFATGFSVGTADITFVEGGKIDGDTSNEIRLIENSDTLKIGFSGDDITIDSTDGGVIFALTDATDGTVDFMTNNDTDDYIQISTTTSQPLINFVGCNGSITAASGTVSFGDDIISTTGTMSAYTLQLENAEIIDNAVDGTVKIYGSANPILSIYDSGTSDSDATLQLISDAGGNNGDTWQIQADGGTQDLLIRNNSSGSQATILTIGDSTGLVTTTGDVIIAGTTPLLTIGDAGGEDAGIYFYGANAFYEAYDYSALTLAIGVGSAIGTTPALSIDSNQNVIIGTGITTPGVRLLVRGSGTATTQALRIQDYDGTDRVTVLDNGSVGIAISAPTGSLQVGTAPGSPILFVNGANVGLGRTAPGAKLDVTGNIRASGTMVGSTLTFSGTGNGIGNTAPQGLLDVGTTPGVGLIVATTGKVGIANTAPAEKLDITGNAIVSGTLTASTLRLSGIANGIGNTAPQGLLDVGTTPGVGLIVKTTGNVGVATTAPVAKLHIVGTSTLPAQGLYLDGSSLFVNVGGSCMQGILTIQGTTGTISFLKITNP